MDQQYHTYEELMDALKQNYLQQKSLLSQLKKFEQNMKPEQMPKTCELKNFNTEYDVPIPLRKLLELTEERLPISTVTRLLYEYVKKHKLCDIKSSGVIIPNSKMRSAFNMKKNDIVTYFNIQIWIKNLYDKYYPNNLANKI